MTTVVGYLLDQERPGRKMISVDDIANDNLEPFAELCLVSRCTSEYHVA